MNHARQARKLAIGLIFLVASTFTIGILRAFIPVQAGSSAKLRPSLTVTLDDLDAAQGSETGSSESNLGTPTPLRAAEYGDTTGITALGILVVMVMLVGIVWGGGFQKKPKSGK